MRLRDIGSVRPAPMAGLVVVMFLSACGVTEKQAQQPHPSVPASSAANAPSSEPKPDVVNASRVAVDVYRAMWDAQVRAFADPTSAHLELREVAVDKALAAVEATIVLYRRTGVAVRGRPTLRPRVTSVDLGASPPSVSIADCIDASSWVPTYVASGQSASAPGQRRRYPATALVVLVGGQWRVGEVIPDRGHPC